ncbi:MAG: nuclear transport factor 2 family protein [Thermodesulfobacteriota bacterium]
MNTTANNIDQIQQTIQYYFDGLYHSDAKKIKKAFHPSSQVSGFFDGNLSIMSLEQFIDFVKATPAPAENGEAYDMKIVSIDITGNEAVVKVEDLYLSLRFTDYLSLLKIDNNWLIVNKVYYYEPK